MNEHLREQLTTIFQAVAAAVENDAAARRTLKSAAESFLQWLDRAEKQQTADPQTETATTPPPAEPAPSPSTQPAPPPRPHVPLAVPLGKPRVPTVLRIGDEMRTVVVRGSADEVRAAAEAAAKRATPSAYPSAGFASDGDELPLVAQRCELKAAACRWAVERRRRVAEGDRSVHATDVEFFAKAKALPNCYLWMMDPRGPSLPEDGLLSALAGNYDAAAKSALLVEALAAAAEDDPLREEALYLLAEAQSALRVGLQRVDETLTDADQRTLFFWLRRQAAERGIYIARHMRLDDEADPGAWESLLQRTADVRGRWDGRQQQKKTRQALVNRAKYHANRLTGGGGSQEDWQKLAGAVEELVTSHRVPASDRDIRDVLVPLADDVPEAVDAEFGPGMRAAMAEADRSLAATETDEGADDAASTRGRAWGEDVRRVRDLLRGKRVVLIGGIPRPLAKRALEDAFDLDELVWLTTRAHQSTAEFEAVVARPDTALVVLAIRWSSHSFGDVKAMCDRYGKPFVRLPAGYNPDQVAAQVLQQCSQVLQAAG